MAVLQISCDLSRFTVPLGGRILLINVVEIDDGFCPTPRQEIGSAVDIFTLLNVFGSMDGSISDTGTFKPRSRAM